MVITYWVVSWELIRNYLKNHFHLCEERGHVSIFCSQHLTQVMNCAVAWNVHGGLCQWRKLLCIYVSLNTWCRWLTVMDITLCAGFSTDCTTLCCRHVSNSWQSTLKNIHVVNTCPYHDFHYDLILAYSICMNQILSLTTLMIIVHGFSCTRKYKRSHDKWHQIYISVLFALVHDVQIWQIYHIKITSNRHFLVCIVFGYVLWHIGIYRFSGFSGEFGVFYELGQYDLLYILWDHNMSMKHPMGPACVGYTLRPLENQIPP